MTGNDYDFADECRKVYENASKNNINVQAVKLYKESMMCEIELEDNIIVDMGREVTYDYVYPVLQDTISITTKDSNISISFVINRNQEKSNIHVISMKDYESDKVLTIKPYVFYSYAKVVGNSKITYEKRMINMGIKDKYMKIINKFIKDIQEKEGLNIEKGYELIYEQLEFLVEKLTEPFEKRKSIKERTRKVS